MTGNRASSLAAIAAWAAALSVIGPGAVDGTRASPPAGWDVVRAQRFVLVSRDGRELAHLAPGDSGGVELVMVPRNEPQVDSLRRSQLVGRLVLRVDDERAELTAASPDYGQRVYIGTGAITGVRICGRRGKVRSPVAQLAIYDDRVPALSLLDAQHMGGLTAADVPGVGFGRTTPPLGGGSRGRP
jgi:hypothetical protein